MPIKIDGVPLRERRDAMPALTSPAGPPLPMQTLDMGQSQTPASDPPRRGGAALQTALRRATATAEKKAKATKKQPTGDYQEGYCRTPEHSRWKKGQSGNPKGRPKGAKSLKTIFEEAAGVKVPLTLNGKAAELPRLEVAVHQLLRSAAAGDLKHVLAALRLHVMLNPVDEEEHVIEAPLGEAELALYRRILDEDC